MYDLDFPTNLKEFNARFGTEEKCRNYLFKVRWPNGFVCPKCGVVGEPWRRQTRDILMCTSCRYECSLKAGTAFHNSKRPLRDWFLAIYYFTDHSKQGTSALGMQRYLGFNNVKAAWIWLHKLRGFTAQEPRLSGEVEVDDAHLGGYLEGSTPGLGSENKVKAIAAVERRGRGCGRVRFQIVEALDAKSIQPAIRDLIEPGSVLSMDAMTGFFSLAKQGYDLDIRTSTDYRAKQKAVRGQRGKKMSELHLKRVGLLTALLKRLFICTYQGRVSRKHLQAYLDEYSFRFNRRVHRDRKPDIPMHGFQELLARTTLARSKTYAEVCRGNSHPKQIAKMLNIEPWWLVQERSIQGREWDIAEV